MGGALARSALALTCLAGCAELPPPPPSIYDSPALAAELVEADGIESLEPRLGGFVHGEPARYWTFDVGGETAMPVYFLCRVEGAEACAPIDHPPVAAHRPGQEGYEPYGQVHWVELPEGWTGRLTSVSAIEAELAALGADPPRSTSELWHCPIAGADAQLEVGPDATAVAERPVYVGDLEARCFDLAAASPNRAVLPDGTLFVRNVYVLTREGEEAPLSEPMRMTDLTGDGDRTDSNNVFGVGLEDVDYTPLWRMVTVTVPATVASIDTTLDDSLVDYASATDMFDVAPDYTITPREGQVVSHTLTEALINCPLQGREGGL